MKFSLSAYIFLPTTLIIAIIIIARLVVGILQLRASVGAGFFGIRGGGGAVLLLVEIEVLLAGVVELFA